MQKTVSILGCGWLGLPLATKLIASDYLVKGSTTRSEKLEMLQSLNIEAYDLELPGLIPDDFLASDILFINVPPGLRRKGESFHLEQINSMIDQIDFSSFQQVIYINSTAVYPSVNTTCKESDADPNHILMRTETQLRACCPSILVLRAAGLVGSDRPIVNMLTGRTFKNGNLPTNLIFKDDIVNICFEAIQQGLTHDVINCACDTHPSKKELYTHWSDLLEITPPHYQDSATEEAFKIISNEKLKTALSYQLKYPDAMNFPIKR